MHIKVVLHDLRRYAILFLKRANCRIIAGVMRMKCPFCSFMESKVIDSRPTDEGSRIRRRRECLKCAKRFTTYEIVESLPIIVVKKTSPERFSTATSCSTGCFGHAKSARFRLRPLRKRLTRLKPTYTIPSTGGYVVPDWRACDGKAEGH